METQKTEHLFFSYTKPTSNSKKTSISITITISILFLCFPLLYLSVLRIPPSNLINDTTFWFILSNSIILLVAADSGLFSSSSSSHKATEHHTYEEFTQPRFAAETTVPKQSEGILKQGSSVQSSSQTDTAEEMEVKTVLPEPISGEEASEYSRMSDEELHRRIEEFISSFNREIKLQQRSGFTQVK